MKLFDEPFDLDAIERSLQDSDFLSLAHLTVGRESNWRAALEQVARLLSIFEDAGRDDAPIYRLISVLIERTGQFPEIRERLAELTSALGLVPGTDYLRQIRLIQLRRSNPEAWQAEKSRAWLEAYRARRRAAT